MEGQMKQTRLTKSIFTIFVFLMSLLLANPLLTFAADNILIGISHDITGVMAPEGRSQKDAAIMAIEEWNQNGGVNGQKVEYDFRNNGGDPTRASGSCKIFVKNGACAVIGASYSTNGIAEMKILAPAKIPMIGGAAAFANFRKGPDGKNYYFSGCGADWALGKAGLAWAAHAGYKNIVIFHLNVAWPKDIRDVQLEWIDKFYGPKYGIKCLKTIEADVKASDLTPQVAQIKALKPDAVICNIYTGTTAALVRAFAALNYNPPWCNYWSAAEAIRQTSEPKLLYNHVGYSYTSGKRQDTMAKKDAFKKRFGYEPVSSWVIGYDAANLILTAVKAVGPNPPAIRDWLAQQASEQPVLGGKTNKTCSFGEKEQSWLGKNGSWPSMYTGTDYAFVSVGKEGQLEWFDIE